jgi:hypothetical protein
MLPELLVQPRRPIARSPVSVFDSTTRRTFSIKSTSRHRSACNSERRTPVRTKVRNATRACSSANERASNCTCSGFRAIPFRCALRGCGIPSAGLRSISSSTTAHLKIEWRIERSLV